MSQDVLYGIDVCTGLNRRASTVDEHWFQHSRMTMQRSWPAMTTVNNQCPQPTTYGVVTSGKSGGPALAGTENRLVVWAFRLVICPGMWLSNTDVLGSMVLWNKSTAWSRGPLLPLVVTIGAVHQCRAIIPMSSHENDDITRTRLHCCNAVLIQRRWQPLVNVCWRVTCQHHSIMPAHNTYGTTQEYCITLVAMTLTNNSTGCVYWAFTLPVLVSNWNSWCHNMPTSDVKFQQPLASHVESSSVSLQ